jgi:hypothetical protein
MQNGVPFTNAIRSIPLQPATRMYGPPPCRNFHEMVSFAHLLYSGYGRTEAADHPIK